MALPLAAALIPAAGSIIAGGLAANASNRAADYNYAANQANIAAGERADLRGQIAAQLARSREEVGSTDAAGNRVEYIPGRGWVTTLSPDQQSLQDASEANQIYNLTQGERSRREGIERGDRARGQEDLTANALLEEFNRRSRTDPQALAGQIFAAGEIGRNQAQDRTNEQMSRTLLRQGNTSNIADILSSRARDSGLASEEASRQAAIQAPDIAAGRDQQRDASTASLYNMFRTRANAPSGTPFQAVSPSGPGRPDTRAIDAGLVNIASRRPIQNDYVQPNFGAANFVAQGSQASGNLLERLFREEQLGKSTDDLNNQRRLGNVG